MTDKIDILAVGVHPDDIELGCGGTLLKHIDLGFQVGAIDLTQGELGTRGSAWTFGIHRHYKIVEP